MGRMSFLLMAVLGLGLGAAPNAGAQSNPTASTSCKTQFPIVLATGLADIAFNGIAEALRACGATVFTTEVDASNTSLVRGQQLLDQIKMIEAMAGVPKVNAIGHSQGGLDLRFVLAMKPEMLASLTQVGSPNLGSPVADVANALGAQAVTQLLGNSLAAIGGKTGTNPVASGQFLSTQGLADFNKKFPAGLASGGRKPDAVVQGVLVFAWGGTAVQTNPSDPSDALLATSSAAFGNKANDGLVGQDSVNAFGKLMRNDLRMNHLDLINQVNGAIGPDDPIRLIYVPQAQLLKAMGL
jgi:triacylglycerol lipase